VETAAVNPTISSASFFCDFKETSWNGSCIVAKVLDDLSLARIDPESCVCLHLAA
jgi:hypothetical protein